MRSPQGPFSFSPPSLLVLVLRVVSLLHPPPFLSIFASLPLQPSSSFDRIHYLYTFFFFFWLTSINFINSASPSCLFRALAAASSFLTLSWAQCVTLTLPLRSVHPCISCVVVWSPLDLMLIIFFFSLLAPLESNTLQTYSAAYISTYSIGGDDERRPVIELLHKARLLLLHTHAHTLIRNSLSALSISLLPSLSSVQHFSFIVFRGEKILYLSSLPPKSAFNNPSATFTD